jgi:sodium transport system permease protein
MNLFGKENVVQLGDSLFIALLLHAVLPAVLEEGLFRYLPMRMLAKDNARVCILISALFFALSHHSLFSIPYAFVAGVAFMTLDIISGSVLPSLVIHLINNALSVIMMFYSVDGNSAILINTLIAILACGSLIYLVMIRERVRRAILENFSKKENYRFSYEILLLVIPTLVISLSELFN